ncbi:exo-alpha-sialidase [Streptomyces hoynatensis]|uniref:exo-alpha-sialidase n=1 Tax=Streptomyces hoynatensis TaxID=1141874 RepID=A0A3A9YZA2_9ACTN|nr:exo-alpha-sialidase [Streptomyces hoynatensis]RKN41200.1 hypothetical protein D7294_15835 [Streptomyces hoynatensis]
MEHRPGISRRSLTLAAAVSAAATLVPLAPAASAAGRRAAAPAARGEFFAETTLWDKEVDPLESYHVHGLAVLPDDTVLAATEGRYESCDAGPRDLLLRRSTDGGRTWQPTRTLVASVDGQSWGNPAFVVDRETGEVFCFYMLSRRLPENTTCSGDTGDLYLISSGDGGETWSEPRNMSGLFDHFPYDWALHNPGPGHGIQLDGGRLLLNCSHRRVIVGNTVEQRYYGVSCLYSDDHGATWQATGEVPVSVEYPINEARLVQLSDGRVLVNGRYASGGNRQRIVSVSADGGLTWSAPALDGATGTFNSVDASLVRYTGGPGGPGQDRILFSRPDSPVRANMTVSVSYDEGRSFRYSRVVNENRSYYSDLAALSDGTILLLYGCDGDEPSFPRRVAICRFSLDWLTRGRDSLAHGPGYAERVVDLDAASARATGGSLAVVADPLATGGSRTVLSPTGTAGRAGPAENGGDGGEASALAAVSYEVEVRRAGEYELLLRYHRTADGCLAEVRVDGRRPHTAVLDTTAPGAAGYDVAPLGTVRLGSGRHTVRFAVLGPGLGGGTRLSLDSLSLIQAPSAPDLREEVLIDNDALGYEVVSGAWSAATGTPGYWGANYRTAPAGNGESAVRWRPPVPREGDWEIQVSYPAYGNRASDAPFTVRHARGTDTVRVDQRVAGRPEPRGGTWVSLGTFRLEAGLRTTVELADDADGYVIADALRLLRR